MTEIDDRSPPRSPAWTSRLTNSGRRSSSRPWSTRAGWPTGYSPCSQSLEDVTDGFAVNQLVHSLQTATRAEEAGADPELVVASLCHDIGKAVSVPNHPKIAAEILRPYVRDEVFRAIEAHQDFQGKHYYEHLGHGPRRPRAVPR